jgi:hypothetical protein
MCWTFVLWKLRLRSIFATVFGPISRQHNQKWIPGVVAPAVEQARILPETRLGQTAGTERRRFDWATTEMSKARSGWVVYMRDERGNFVYLTKAFEKKEQADEERMRLYQRDGYRRGMLGVGFVR